MTRICFWFRKNTTGAGPLGASHQAADSFDRDEAFPRKRTVGDVGTWYVFVQKKDLKDVHPWKLTSNRFSVADVFRVVMYVYLEPFDDPGISPSCFAWSFDLVLEGEKSLSTTSQIETCYHCWSLKQGENSASGKLTKTTGKSSKLNLKLLNLNL